MSLDLSVEDQQLLEDTYRRAESQMTMRERISEFVTCAGFVVAGALLWWLQPPAAFAVGPVVLCVLVLALATLVKFDTVFGFTVPTQLAFVPLLFAAPVSTVPFAVLIALSLAAIRDLATGELAPSRTWRILGNGWFAIGPVAMFELAGVAPANAGAAVLIAALLAQFVVDFVVSGIRDSISTRTSIATHVRESWIYAIDAALAGVGLVVAREISSSPAAVLSLVPLLGLLAFFAHERRQRLEGVLELGNAYRGTALVLGDVVEADDGYTGEHCKSVVSLALDVADVFNLDAQQRRNLEFGALLHDVGKIAIPKEIINKPGKLDAAEWTVIKTHTVEGQKMLERVGGFMRDVGLIVRSHHERWDGAGYPDGLGGERIPLEARIIACCDTWNAMRTDRAYRKALSHEVALTELMANVGTQFDPAVVEALLEVIEPATKPIPVGVADSRPALPGASVVIPSQAA
ncbi:MAG TPA: HD-GYP domain-containing protein [Solirubrobacteraceae bacterium]|jgi:putative nucleotidyltransferase with HDIG domain|nr:HD-GYP domain-containing protein [Solirubrobacteraceae bacterium]